MQEGRRAEPERISCLMVTRPCPERFALLRRSVDCFRAQTYANRELVIVADQGPAEWVERIREHVADLGDDAVVLQPAGPRCLGALRNASIAAASGDVLCQWDDDDLSHPGRLARQHAPLSAEGALGVALRDFLHFFTAARQLYWLDFRRTRDGCHAGTIMFRRGVAARCPEEGPYCHGSEDRAFLEALRTEGKVVTLADAAHLYVYVYHGSNTCTEEHHLKMQLLALSRGLLLRRREALLAELACFDLGEQPIQVMGYNGPAFEIAGPRPPGPPKD